MKQRQFDQPSRRLERERKQKWEETYREELVEISNHIKLHCSRKQSKRMGKIHQANISQNKASLQTLYRKNRF